MLETAPTLTTAGAIPASAPAPAEKIAGAFYAIWLGQFVSMMGTHLTGFALGVWLFQRTGSVMDFASLTLFSTLPALLLMPFSGSIADAWDKRKILIACEALAMLATGAMALLFWFDAFEVWHLMALQALLAVSLAFQAPAAYATITMLVPKSQFAKAGGMFQIAGALSQFAGPLLAASILGVIGISGIVTLDALSFAIALLALVLARFPLLAAIPPDQAKPKRDALKDMEWAFNFLVERPSMAALYGYTMLGSFLSGMVVVLIAPMVLTYHSEQVLAWVSTSAAVGVLCSGLVLVAWGGPKTFTPLVLLLNAVQGVAIALAGYNTSVLVLCVCAFVAMLSSATLAGYMSTVWRRKLPKERQGAFSALQQAVGLSMLPLSAIIGGTLAQYLFEPALLAGGFWADSVGAWFGTGKGRGNGFLFVVIGLAGVAVALLSLCHRRLYRFDSDVPDAF
jgi:DHA3 family macrolide efflux protein-like MFS transporter